MNPVVFMVLTRALAAGTPLLLGTLGEVIAERSGVLNLGVEGMMSLGAVTGFIVTFSTGSVLLGLLTAFAVGALASLLHAFASITLRANQVVSGLALTMLGLGLSGLLGKPYIGKPLTIRMEFIKIPLLGDIPILGKILFNQDPFFYLAVILGILAWIFMYRTRGGIALRSVGEHPQASEAQGIKVHAVRYVAVLTGGGLAGLAGAHLSLSYSSSWIEGMTAGRGWIVIALTIFALWNPLRAFIGAFLFGGIFVLQYLLQPLGISPSLLAMLPYVTTLMVLVLGGLSGDRRHMHAPAQLGEPYVKGERV
ncbi:MAG: ABC transporter permease [Spirochaetales bacterium]|nr:MAG: ABC transporter permease [Spirochaetales bacterium]